MELHIQRVAERVRQGGHDVPVEDIRRRYRRSLVNLFELYQPLADNWAVFDNTSKLPRKVASMAGQAIALNDTTWYDSMKQKAEEYGRKQHQP